MRVMRDIIVLPVLVALLVPAFSSGQRGYPPGRRPEATAAPTATPWPTVMPPVMFRARLKSLTKKKIVVESDAGGTATVRRTKKTKFFQDEKEIKPTDIPVGSSVALDLLRDPDYQFSVISLTVIGPPPDLPAKHLKSRAEKPKAAPQSAASPTQK